MSFNSSSK